MKKSTPAFVLILLCAICLTSSTQQSTEPYKDPKLPIEQRVNDLISRLTVEEKASQLVHVADPIPRLGVPAYNWWNEGLHGVARAEWLPFFRRRLGWQRRSMSR